MDIEINDKLSDFLFSSLNECGSKDIIYKYLKTFLSELYDCEVEIEEKDNYSIEISFKKKFLLVEV